MMLALWTGSNVKNHSTLNFLKLHDAEATGLCQDTETILGNIEDKNYWITINSKKGKAKPIPS